MKHWFRSWLLDVFARDEVLDFARSMMREKNAEIQRLIHENAELIVHKHHLYGRIRELKKQIARMEDER